MMSQISVLLTLCGIMIGVIVLDLVAQWMERRGWIYWREHKPGGGGGATAGLLTGFQQIIEPQVEHRIQVMDERNESIGQRQGRGDDVDGKHSQAAAHDAGTRMSGDPRIPTK